MGRRTGASRGRKLRPAQKPPSPVTPRPLTPFERELTTKRRGELSELAFALAAARNGFGISKPFGDSERYDIILDPSQCNPPNSGARPRLVRVQVKSSTSLLYGLYHVSIQRSLRGRVVPYRLSEIDFIAAYVIPEDSWFLFPFPHIHGRSSLLLSPKRRRRHHPYDGYREAWRLLREPDGIEFA
jgi:hypothetical protein